MQCLPSFAAANSRVPETKCPATRNSCQPQPQPQTQRFATLRARVQSQQRSSQAQEDCGPSYPDYEETTAQDGLLPKRQPGQFPGVKSSSISQRLKELPLAGTVVDSIMGTNVELAEGAVFDPLRDGPLRYLGYANECGEAFAAWLPIWGVPGSYVVAVSYVVTDTIDKGFKAFDQARQELEGNVSLPEEVKTSRWDLLTTSQSLLD